MSVTTAPSPTSIHAAHWGVLGDRSLGPGSSHRRSQYSSAQASAGDLEGVCLLVHAGLAQDYFNLRAVDAQKQLLDATVTAYQKALDLTKNRYVGGVASQADVLQAETQLKGTQTQAIDLGVQRAQIDHAIALLCGKPASFFSVPVVSLTRVPPPVPVGLPSELLERRPDIAAAERRMAAANAQIGVAVAAYYPTITLSGSAGFEASSLAKWLSWPSRSGRSARPCRKSSSRGLEKSSDPAGAGSL